MAWLNEFELPILDYIRDNFRIDWLTPIVQVITRLADKGAISLPFIPEDCTHNAHMFYIKAEDLSVRSALISRLKENGVSSVFHYIPLHGAPAGQRYGRFHGEDVYTTRESERLLRLPMYYGLKPDDIDFVCDQIEAFYQK